MTSATRIFWLVLALALLISRSAHVDILWADEDYHLAAGIQILRGKMLYRDIWYDKPPLTALLMTLFGAWPGWPLRIFSVLLDVATAVVAFRFASQFWTPRAGYAAAALYGFFQIFYHAHTVIPLEPDSVMILPHLAAVYLAWRGKGLWSGTIAGIACLINTKGLFVLLACIALNPSGWLAILAGCSLPLALTGFWLHLAGAWNDYLQQVWRWGFLYAENPPAESVLARIARFASWQGFHAALWIGALAALARATTPAWPWRLAIWLGLSVGAACVGWRFSPRYFDQTIPPLVILAAGGIAAIWTRRIGQIALIIAVTVPLIRFGPRYVLLLTDDAVGRKHEWRDIAMDQESREGAELVQKISKPGDTVFVWGYRPNVVTYTRLPIAGQFWDSQPVTMVPADRHLGESTALDAEWSRENQRILARTSPTILVDGLSAYNPKLAIQNFPLLTDWFRGYCKAGDSIRGITIYRLCGTTNSR